jgi:hypothetical protein
MEKPTFVDALKRAPRLTVRHDLNYRDNNRRNHEICLANVIHFNDDPQTISLARVIHGATAIEAKPFRSEGKSVLP